ncbi:flagellar biosynthesis protein FlgA [Streptomyces sp. Rer75]|uniref:flagellar biosynthesis protein FlgA n=1 Tax=Streptomyces sp. Rer75 TaxID=2750011 RepID=UPI0015D0081E|nr:flagellar biosynthesis protein FlgA [Streptomyces sp. Rer75]QLH21833.1 flagellar biosynthesis protein FlgA [Streptomyces sp. Rer75]
MSYLPLGALLVLGCSAGGVVMALNLGHRQAALALAHPVTVGQTLMEQDLREVNLARGSGLVAISAGSTDQVVGRPVAYSMPRGTLLTESVLGERQIPPRGKAVVAVGLKEGRFPSALERGSRVAVVQVTEPGGDSTKPPLPKPSSPVWYATVVAVWGKERGQTAVVSLQLGEDEAREVAALPSDSVSVLLVREEAL